LPTTIILRQTDCMWI